MSTHRLCRLNRVAIADNPIEEGDPKPGGTKGSNPPPEDEGEKSLDLPE